jgi:hypothetical protein
MWQLRGCKSMGGKGGTAKKLEEFFYPLSLKDFVFKTERQFSPINNLIKKSKFLSEDLGIML